MLLLTTSKIISRVIVTASVLLLATTALATSDNRSSFEKIDDAFKTGSISRSEMLVEQMKALFHPEELSAGYKSASPSFIKSGTGLVTAVADNWDNFTEEQQILLSSYMGRPALPYFYDSPLGFFKIHYNTDAPEPVPPQDLDGDAVPDYVERIAEFCDSSWLAYAGMGYLPPPSDGITGGDSKYDIYLASIYAYGITTQDGPGDSAWNDYRSYIWIHYSFLVPWLYQNDDPQGDTIGAQKVTCAHEFHHATQFAYNYDPANLLWIMEATSTWMEEVVFPEVNDNYNYLPYFFSVPQRSLNSIDAYHQYGAFIWDAFLTQRFDSDILRRYWETARYSSSLDSFDSVLASYGTTLKNIIPEFAAWNYFTGSRAVPGKYYVDAADYPLISMNQTFTELMHDSIAPLDGPDGMASNYLEFAVDGSAHGILEILLEGSSLVRWADVAVASDIGNDTLHIKISSGTDPTRIYIPFIEDYATVTVAPTVISRYLTDNNYYLTTKLIPYGDANYDYQINVGDASYLVNYVFLHGASPKPILETGDANCDGWVNVADAVTIINYVFKSGAEPCAARIPQ